MKVAIYTETKVHPQVQDILQAIFDDYPQITDAELWSLQTEDHVPTLVLGNFSVGELPARFVKTLSQKQILSNPAAVTELKAAVKLLLEPVVYAPMKFDLIDGHRIFSAAWLRNQFHGNVVVVDIETGGDIDIMTPEETWLLSVAITDGRKNIVIGEKALADPLNRQALAKFFTSGIKLVAHNMKFDFRTLTAQLGVDIKGHLDTMLLHHSLNPGAKEHGLKALCRKYLGAPDWDGNTKEYVHGYYKQLEDWYPALLRERYSGRKVAVGFEAIPRAKLYLYNAYDVYWTWHLMNYLSRAVANDDRVMKIAKFEFDASNLFQDVEKTGVAVDLEYLDELHTSFVQQEIDVLAQIQAYTGKPKFNPNSPKQVKEQYAEYGHVLKSTAVGKLEDLIATDVDEETRVFTDLLLQARKITKMKGTYIVGIQKRVHNGLVFPDFLVHGTSTGRLSSRDPNIQNIPRDEDGKVSLRRIFIPRDVETRSLVSVDYSQAELRVMACMSEDEYLISLFQPGMPDFFDSLMPVAFPRHNLAELDKDTKKNMRAKLKGVIYGMSYGRKAAAIAKALGMPVWEAQQIMNNYFKAAPSLYDWRMWIEQMAVSPEHTLISPFGRYYQAEVVTGRGKQNIVNSGLAFLPQSTASDICVTAAIEVHKQLPAFDATIVATIHDAILMDCPDEHIEEVSTLVQCEMEKAGDKVFNGVVPFATEATHGKSWKGI